MANDKKLKKPFYKRWWFIIIMLLIIISLANGEDEKELSTNIIEDSVNVTGQKQVAEEPREHVSNEKSVEPAEVKLSKEEELKQFKESMDIDSIKSKYSEYTREKIRLIQKKLNLLGYAAGKEDGIIGENTILAVAEYQYDQDDYITGFLSSAEVIGLGITEKMQVTVSLNSVSMVHNNSVGNEWSYGFHVNDKEYIKGESHEFMLNTEENLQVSAIMSEDDKVPDNGRNTVIFKYSDLAKGISKSQNIEVVVTENRGRYSGNTAKWRFKYSVKVNMKLELENK